MRLDYIGPSPKICEHSYKSFQGSHVSDLPQYFQPPLPGSTFAAPSMNVPPSGLHLPQELVSHLIQLLSDKNCFLSIDIQSHTKAIYALTSHRSAVLIALQAIHHLIDGQSTDRAS